MQTEFLQVPPDSTLSRTILKGKDSQPLKA